MANCTWLKLWFRQWQGPSLFSAMQCHIALLRNIYSVQHTLYIQSVRLKPVQTESQSPVKVSLSQSDKKSSMHAHTPYHALEDSDWLDAKTRDGGTAIMRHKEKASWLGWQLLVAYYTPVHRLMSNDYEHECWPSKPFLNNEWIFNEQTKQQHSFQASCRGSPNEFKRHNNTRNAVGNNNKQQRHTPTCQHHESYITRGSLESAKQLEGM